MVAGAITVVQLIPELNSGGVERGTLELGRYLSLKGHRSIVISSGGRLVSSLVQEGSRHLFWPIGEKNPRVLPYILSLRRLLKEERIDILHARSRLPAWIGYLAWKSLPERGRTRFVTTFHGYYSVNRYSAVMTRGERVIAISRAVADHIRNRYGVPEKRIELIYRGFDEKAFDPESVAPLRIERLRRLWRLETNRTPIVMLPARLTRWKGHDVFIRSLGRIKSLPWLALCVGDAEANRSYRDALSLLIDREGLRERVRMVGHCTDMPAALSLADVVVSASSAQPEAFGRVAVEAQGMGKAVIATAHGGSLETVLDRETGWLVPPCDVESLSKALAEAVLNRRMRKEFGDRGSRWVREHFTTGKMCEKTVALYQRLARERA
jgi:glycosyltransferase involved in cell wall biosynthesis